jgi:hypothetical protein
MVMQPVSKQLIGKYLRVKTKRVQQKRCFMEARAATVVIQRRCKHASSTIEAVFCVARAEELS